MAFVALATLLKPATLMLRTEVMRSNLSLLWVNVLWQSIYNPFQPFRGKRQCEYKIITGLTFKHLLNAQV